MANWVVYFGNYIGRILFVRSLEKECYLEISTIEKQESVGVKPAKKEGFY